MSFDLEKPEAFLGTMIALEGVKDAATIIHGPTGCKMYPSDLTERLFIHRKDEIETRNAFLRSEKYFFYQPRLPCTLLDGNRLIMGASERLKDLYSIVMEDGPRLIGIINSPGASLTGENLNICRSDIPTLRFESHEFSAPMQDGFSECSIRIIDLLSKRKDVVKGTANIFGLSIWHINFEDQIEELGRILSLCGIKINCCLCAGSSVEDIENISSAELNIVVDRDFGSRVAEHCRERFGTPFIDITPIGFDATENMLKEVCSKLGKDPSKALDDSKVWRRKTAKMISALEKRYVRMRGRTFSVHSTPALADAVTSFVYDYLGIVPVAVQYDGVKKENVLEFPVSDDVWEEYADILFGSANEIAALKMRNTISDGVCISNPDSRPVNIFPRPLMGTLGAVCLMEDTLNILSRINDRL